jgi:hypothetical protein
LLVIHKKTVFIFDDNDSFIINIAFLKTVLLIRQLNMIKIDNKCIVIIICIICNLSTSMHAQISNRLFGLTIDESSFDEDALKINAAAQIEHILVQLRKIKNTNTASEALTVRIVLPIGCEGGANCDAAEPINTNKLDAKYVALLKQIKEENLAIIMAEIVDSDIESSTACFKINDKAKSVAAYVERTKKLFSKLKNYVDIWEIGNEVNGDWFGGSVNGNAKNVLRRKIVVAQLYAAYQYLSVQKIEIKASNKINKLKDKVPQIAMTYYFSGIEKNRYCYENINDEMTNWMKSEGDHFLDDTGKKMLFTNLDYVLVSYYPDDNFYTPASGGAPQPIVFSAKDWVSLFANILPHFSADTKFGLGEVGAQCYYSNKSLPCDACKTILLDYDTHQKNPCDKYDAKGETIESRKCPCCQCAQVKVMRDYYTDLDGQIMTEMKNDNRFKDANQFVGGYFNWYYSSDVLNKLLVGNAADKAQAQKVNEAIIEAYKNYIR